MLYGSELWGVKQMPCIENVHIYACKKFLNASLKACNDSVLGDVGRYHMYIVSQKRCIKYWIRIINMPCTRYVKKCYMMLKFYDSIGHINWVSHVRQNLYTNGFGYVWENQNVESVDMFLVRYEQRLKDQFVQIWHGRCSVNRKLNNYMSYKTTFTVERYVSCIDINKFRKALANFRASSHSLMIEVGRYYDIDREFRYCQYCECVIEDEFHFLLICPLYTRLRMLYIPDVYCNEPSIHKFNNLMACQNENVLRNLACFIYHAFKERQIYLDIFS